MSSTCRSWPQAGLRQCERKTRQAVLGLRSRRGRGPQAETHRSGEPLGRRVEFMTRFRFGFSQPILGKGALDEDDEADRIQKRGSQASFRNNAKEAQWDAAVDRINVSGLDLHSIRTRFPRIHYAGAGSSARIDERHRWPKMARGAPWRSKDQLRLALPKGAVNGGHRSLADIVGGPGRMPPRHGNHIIRR